MNLINLFLPIFKDGKNRGLNGNQECRKEFIWAEFQAQEQEVSLFIFFFFFFTDRTKGEKIGG